MPHVQAQRRLVKSPPELWNELSDAASLARHLGEFGEIRITRLEPETKVVWEGDSAAGTVELESAGWGTQVTFTVEVEAPEPEPSPSRSPSPSPSPNPSRNPNPSPSRNRTGGSPRHVRARVGRSPEAPRLPGAPVRPG